MSCMSHGELHATLPAQTRKGALLLDSVPYGRSGDWAVSMWVRFGNLFGNGAVASTRLYTEW